MNKESALARLGLSGSEDTATVAKAYGERLSAVQEKLVTADSDADRQQCRATLAELVEAYEFMTRTGRYTDSGANDDTATVMRSETQLAHPPAGDTAVRMEPGAVLASRLEIGELLGSGGMGNVYAARDRLKNEDVAIKVLRQDLQFSVAAKDRFLAEAKVSCHLSHPNIVRVHDVGVSGAHYYFSMERLKGHTLRQRMEVYHRENREFSVFEVSDIARQLIDALRYAHRYIVHRDIKPENIWLAEDGTVKLMDFGIARAFTSSQLTQTGMTLGTAYYMAPEQRIAAKEVDWRADQYALGVVLYELLAGTLPTGAVKPLELIRKDLPKRYARALMRAMSPKPDDRFSSLNALLADIDVPATASRTRVGGMLLIGAGLVAAAAGAFIVINRQVPERAPETVTTAETDSKSEAVAPEAAASATAQPAQAPPASPPVESGSSGDGDAPTPPPEAAQVAAAAPTTAESETHGAPVDAKPVETSSVPPVQSGGTSQRVARADTARIDARRQECLLQCDRDGGECRSINRRSKQDCMRAVAFNSSGRLTTTNPAAAECAFYGQARCDRAFDREACLSRITARHQACIEVLGGSIASRRQDCEEKSHQSDQMCLDELRECRASCQD